jgi:hypothetical protein
MGSTGGVSGELYLSGERLGEFQTFPSDDDPITTDYVTVSADVLADIEPGQRWLRTGSGQSIKQVTVEPASDRERGDWLPEGSSPDDTPESDPADAPGLVTADNAEEAALAPALRERLGNIGGVTPSGVEFGPAGGDSGASNGSGLGLEFGVLAGLAAVAWVVMN